MPGKKYGKAELYEEKLERVMKRLKIDKYDFVWGKSECWVAFVYKGEFYRFYHSLENAAAHGQTIKYGSDLFAQVILTLEDLARMVERGLYELETWVSGMKYLPETSSVPDCFRVLQFDGIPESAEEVEKRFRQLVKTAHPDTGGSSEQFTILQAAREQAEAYFKGEKA